MTNFKLNQAKMIILLTLYFALASILTSSQGVTVDFDGKLNELNFWFFISFKLIKFENLKMFQYIMISINAKSIDSKWNFFLFILERNLRVKNMQNDLNIFKHKKEFLLKRRYSLSSIINLKHFLTQKLSYFKALITWLKFIFKVVFIINLCLSFKLFNTSDFVAFHIDSPCDNWKY